MCSGTFFCFLSHQINYVRFSKKIILFWCLGSFMEEKAKAARRKELEAEVIEIVAFTT